LDHSDLQQIDPDVLEHYENFSTSHSTGSNSLPPEEHDEDIKAMRDFESSLYFSF